MKLSEIFYDTFYPLERKGTIKQGEVSNLCHNIKSIRGILFGYDELSHLITFRYSREADKRPIRFSTFLRKYGAFFHTIYSSHDCFESENDKCELTDEQKMALSQAWADILWKSNESEIKVIEPGEIYEYYSAIEDGRSCMTGNNRVRFYDEQKDNVKLVVGFLEGQPVGRALLWKLDNDEGYYLDKVYSSHNNVRTAIRRFAKTKFDARTDLFPSWTHRSVTLIDRPYGGIHYPYMDTFRAATRTMGNKIVLSAMWASDGYDEDDLEYNSEEVYDGDMFLEEHWDVNLSSNPKCDRCADRIEGCAYGSDGWGVICDECIEAEKEAIKEEEEVCTKY